MALYTYAAELITAVSKLHEKRDDAMRLLIATLLLSFISPVAAIAETLVATNMDPDWEGINGWAWYIGYSGPNGYINEAAGQEFVSFESGTLTTLEASVDRFAGGAPLVITFHEAVANRPGPVLGSVEIAPADVGRWASDISTPINTFDVSGANVFVVAGQNYFVTFTTPLAGDVRYRAILTAHNANSFGYRSLYSKDAGATWVYPNITPEIGMRLYGAEITHQVAIDVRTDSKKDQVRLGKRNPKPLAVDLFGSSAVAVEDVLIASLELGDPTIAGGLATPPLDAQFRDLNGDDDMDLALTFDLGELEANGSIDANSSALELRGYLVNEDALVGSDAVDIAR